MGIPGFGTKRRLAGIACPGDPAPTPPGQRDKRHKIFGLEEVSLSQQRGTQETHAGQASA